jgi:hypothetical protein
MDSINLNPMTIGCGMILPRDINHLWTIQQMARDTLGIKTTRNGLNLVNSFDILQHTPFMIKTVDATWLLEKAYQSGNEDFMDMVMRLKSYESTPLDHMDILQAVWEVDEQLEE